MSSATLTVKKLFEHFMKEELQKTSKAEFMFEKVIMKKCKRLHFKWEGYDNSFITWINVEYMT